MESQGVTTNARETQQILDLGSPQGPTGVPPAKLSRPEFFLRKSKPKPTQVFATYWHFAKARQDIYFDRLADPRNASPSHDPILKRHRFTNVYRASDRVSQYLIRNVLYDRDWSPDDLVFRALIFKFFNKIETWEALTDAVGSIQWDRYDFDLFDHCLSRLMAQGQKIYSAAYIMPSGKSVFGYKRKHRNHLKIIEEMMSDRLPDRLGQQPNLKSVYQLLRRYPCIGPFVGYQLTIDFNYSPLVDFSENEFVEPGPGALDGISKCFSDLGDYTPAEIIEYMVDVQSDAFERYAPGFRTLWGRSLHLIDCQNLFCETDKYARIAHPEIEGRSKRSRIKQLFRPSARTIAPPWYPPKWGINTRISDTQTVANS